MTTNWEQAYHQAYDSHGRALLLFARQWANSLSDAEDLVQEGFVKVFKARERLDAQRLVPALYNAVRWAGIDRVRSRIRRERREELTSPGQRVAWFETSLETDERRQQIQIAMTQLPDEQREVLVMKIWGELSFREIGEALDVSINTAASRYRYGLEALRKILHAERDLLTPSIQPEVSPRG